MFDFILLLQIMITLSVFSNTGNEHLYINNNICVTKTSTLGLVVLYNNADHLQLLFEGWYSYRRLTAPE
jgi:hypothetical protein